MKLIATQWFCCVLLSHYSTQALTPLEAKSMSAKVVISSGVEFQSSAPGYGQSLPDVSSVLATLTSFPRESFHQKVENIDVTGNPQPEAVTRDEFNNLQLYWTKPDTGMCSFQLQASVDTKAEILPIKQKIRFPVVEEILPSDVVNDYLQITEIANQNAEIQELAHTISRQVPDPSDLYHVVFAIADWVKTSIKYDQNAMKNPQNSGVCKSATETLRTGIGKCDELSALFVSMNRALGIPARFVTGYAYTNIPIGAKEDDPKNWGGHAWAEVYFPGIGWVPFDVAYGEYGYLSAGHIMLSTSDDAADNTNVHYHAQGFDFTITPRIIDIAVTPQNLDEDKWSDWSSSTAQQDVQVSLEAPQASQQAGIGEVIRLLCTLKNPHDHYVCARLDIANTQDTTLLDDVSDNVLLSPKESKQVPLSFQVDPTLQKGYAYEFPFSVASGKEEARTTIMVKDRADSRQKQIQGMKMQWENPARQPFYDDPRGPPPSSYNDGRDRGSTGNSAGDWWGEGGSGKSMFMSNQPRQPTPEDWKRAEERSRGGNDDWRGPQDNRYPASDQRYPGNDRQYQNERGYHQDPYQPPPTPPNQWNPNQAENRGGVGSYGQPRPTTAPSTSQDNDWYDKAGTKIYDESNGWWNKEKREGVARNYESKYVDQKKEDTSWSMGPQGRVDDTKSRPNRGYDSRGGQNSYATPGQNSYPGTGQNSYGTTTQRGYDSATTTGQNQNGGRSSYYNEGNKSAQRFQNSNRYDDSFFSKGQQQQQQQQPNQYGPNTQGYSSYDQDGWRGDGNAQKNFSNDWQRNDLLGRSREKYLQEQMRIQPPPPPGFGGPFDGPYGPPPPPGMDPYNNRRGDYLDDRMGNPQDYNTGRRRDATSSYYGNVDRKEWWDDK